MSSDANTALLTVEGLRAMVAERDALWARANALSEQIDHIRKFMGEEKFTAVVGTQAARMAPPASALEPGVSRRGRRELTMREVILAALADKPEGMPQGEVRELVRASGNNRSYTGFFNAVHRMQTQGEVVRFSDRLYSPEAFAALPPEKVAELEAGPRRGQNTNIIRGVIESHGRGMTSAEVIAALNEVNSRVNVNTIYATLSRLVKEGILSRDEYSRYSIIPENGGATSE